MNKTARMIIAASLIVGFLFSTTVSAQSPNRMYKVTVTNTTSGQYFTPILAVTHKSDIALFDLGLPASPELEALAENGMTMPLEEAVADSPNVVDTATSAGLLGPGESTTLLIEGRALRLLSLAAMMLPTHDTFMAVDSMILPRNFGEYTAIAYDAGTEENDELCDNIPGPQCGGSNVNDDSGEGYVHIANGIHGIGDLDPAAYDWRNPVAQITVRRMR